jgi:hypothetical protein
MSAARERDAAEALDRRILEFLDQAASDWRADPGVRDRLLMDVFAHQARWNPAIARLAAARGIVPGKLARIGDIPPVPARAFTRLRMATFPAERTIRTFRSSGTTGSTRAVLELDTLALYDAALVPAFVRHLLPDRARLAWVALAPDPQQTRDSSLAYMIGAAATRLGADPSYWVRGDALDHDGARARLSDLAHAREPVLVLGTALALLALTEAMIAANQRIELAPGSRVMETGGFKGRRRGAERPGLYAAIAERLHIPVHAIVGEYGMTEMVSQSYDSTLRTAAAGMRSPDDDPCASRCKEHPPWMLSLVVDPRTLERVGEGEEGVLLHLDPAARSSAVALLTEDRARARGSTFELLGRMPAAEPRGCSLAFDEPLRIGTGS